MKTSVGGSQGGTGNKEKLHGKVWEEREQRLVTRGMLGGGMLRKKKGREGGSRRGNKEETDGTLSTGKSV